MGVENEISCHELDRRLCALSPDGRILATIAKSMDEISLFDTITGEKIRQFDLIDSGEEIQQFDQFDLKYRIPHGMLFTSDSQGIFVTQVNGFAKVLKIHTGKEALSIRVHDTLDKYLDKVILSPDGNLVAVCIDGKLTI